MPTRIPDLSAFPLPSELPSHGDSVQRPELAEFIQILETLGPDKPNPDLPTIIRELPDDMPGGSGDAEQSEDDAGMPDGLGQIDDSAGGDTWIIGGGGNGGGKDDW